MIYKQKDSEKNNINGNYKQYLQLSMHLYKSEDLMWLNPIYPTPITKNHGNSDLCHFDYFSLIQQ